PVLQANGSFHQLLCSLQRCYPFVAHARSWVPSLWRTCGGLTAPVHGVRSQFLASRSGNWLTSGLFLAPTAQCSLELRSWFLRPFALPVFRRASSLLRPLLTSPALSRR